MQGEKPLDKLESYFASTFIDELIPGIMHNFANPLNGIMGRSQIMERRLENVFAKLEQEHPTIAAQLSPLWEKLRKDVYSICQESDRFFSMFRDVSDKFNIIKSETVERIDLGRLISLELRFADHYLEFKHQVIKEIFLEEGLPEVKGKPRAYSLGLWAFLRYIQSCLKGEKNKKLRIGVKGEGSYVSVNFSYPVDNTKRGGESAILYKEASDLFQEMGVKVELKSTPGEEVLSLFFPC